MRVLDIYSCAGGGAAGYARAGWDVVGIDRDPQPHYPFEFHQYDAIKLLTALIDRNPPWEFGYSLDDFDAIHASPPCQTFTRYRNRKSVRASTDANYENLIPQTREILQSVGLPYIMENVPGAPLKDYVQLCGTSFGIRVRRHRWFETNWDVGAVPPCDHGRFTDRIFPGSSNRPNGRTVCNVGEYRVPLPIQKQAMTVDWMVTLHELSEMVPPPMTEFLGLELMKHLDGDTDD